MPAYTRDIESSGQTDFPRDVAEMALAHTIANGMEAAYRRGDLFEKRRQLMEAWKSYCAINITDPKVSNVDQRQPATYRPAIAEN